MKISNLSKYVLQAVTSALVAVAIGGCGGGGGSDNPLNETVSGKILFPSTPMAFSMRMTDSKATTDEVWQIGQAVRTQISGVSVVSLTTPDDVNYFQFVGDIVKIWSGSDMVTFLPGTIKVGDTWSFSQRGTVTNVLVLPRATITVPHGTYPDCWVIQMTAQYSQTETGVTTLWFSENEGLIKQTEKVNGVLQATHELLVGDIPATQATGSTLLPLAHKTMVFTRTQNGVAVTDFNNTYTTGFGIWTRVEIPMRMFNTISSVALRSDNGIIWDYNDTSPFVRLPARIQTGSTWPIGNQATGGKLLRRETITVPAGSFDCFVIEFTQFSYVSRWWFAPGVGVVKYEVPSGEIQDEETGVLRYLDMVGPS